MKAEETRNNLINELNVQFAKTGSFFGAPEIPDEPIVSFPSPTFEKPKMFEPFTMEHVYTATNVNSNTNTTVSEAPVIKGIGFKDSTPDGIITIDRIEKKAVEPQEIYNMKDLINSNPEGMRTLSYDTKTVKAQFALVKRKEWQDILFDDIDWFKPIDFSSGFKKLFRL